MRVIPEMRARKAARNARPPGVKRAAVASPDRGLRLTAPRHAVLGVLRSITTHPTAEEVHRLVLRRAPGISLGTGYRNLQLLVEARLVGELLGPRARFEHPDLSKRVEPRTGHTITYHRIDFFDRCREC